MPKTIGELINDLAQKAGVATDDAKLKALLASPELATITVDDALYASIDSKLLSLDSAKNNHPEILNKYLADFMHGMDKKLYALIESDTFDAADVEEIKAEPRTHKKLELVISKLKAAKASASPADKEAINAHLAAAHAAAKAAKDEVAAVKSDYEGKIKHIQLDAAIASMIGNYKTIYDDLPAGVRKATMTAIINQGLQDKNAEFKIDEHGNLQLLAKDGSNVFGDNHVQLTHQSFLDKTFAPILKVSGPPKPAPQNRPQPPVNAGSTPADRHVEATTDFIKSHTDKVLADMGSAPVSMI